MKMKSIKYVALFSLVIACGTGAGEPTTTPTETEDSTQMSLPEGLPEALGAEIIADAADRTGVPISEIAVVSVEEKTFNDASLGCPEPDRMYAQVLTPGLIVLVDAGGEELDYRVASGSDAFRLCE